MMKKSEFVPYQFDWITISTIIGKMATSIKSGEHIENELAELIIFIMSIAKIYNINLQHAWYKWKKKANDKVYSS